MRKFFSFRKSFALNLFFVIGNPDHGANRSTSGDTVILILAISGFYEFKHRITIDSVSARKRKNVWLGTIELIEEHCLVLVGIQAFSGNNYTSTFLKRGKEKMLEDY